MNIQELLTRERSNRLIWCWGEGLLIWPSLSDLPPQAAEWIQLAKVNMLMKELTVFPQSSSPTLLQ